jgi:RimJ/RimL family protein N-acetyltransferase
MKLRVIKNNDLKKFINNPKNKFIKNQFEDNIYSIDFIDKATKGYDTNNKKIFYAVYWTDPINHKLVATCNIIYIPKYDKDRIFMNSKKKMFEIRDLFILPEFRGHGYCSQFVNDLSNHIKKHNICKVLKLDVLSTNEKAIKCYKRSNFKIHKNQNAEEYIDKNFINIYGFDPKCKPHIMIKNIK